MKTSGLNASLCPSSNYLYFETMSAVIIGLSFQMALHYQRPEPQPCKKGYICGFKPKFMDLGMDSG